MSSSGAPTAPAGRLQTRRPPTPPRRPRMPRPRRRSAPWRPGPNRWPPRSSASAQRPATRAGRSDSTPPGSVPSRRAVRCSRPPRHASRAAARKRSRKAPRRSSRSSRSARSWRRSGPACSRNGGKRWSPRWTRPWRKRAGWPSVSSASRSGFAVGVTRGRVRAEQGAIEEGVQRVLEQVRKAGANRPVAVHRTCLQQQHADVLILGQARRQNAAGPIRRRR